MLFFYLSFVQAQDILIQNARLIDARGDMGIHSVLVSNEKIADIDPSDIPEFTKIIDINNQTLMPGIIDSHIHITMSPGEAYRNESIEERKKRHARHMRAFLALGITTIVDPGISVQNAHLVRQLQKDTPSPDILFIGPIIGPMKGYPSNVVPDLPGVTSAEEIRERIEEFSTFDPLGIKITMEDGPFMSVLPIFDAKLRDIIQEEAKRAQKELYIHATDTKHTNIALDMNPRTLVHTPHKFNKKLAKRIVEQEVYVCSTLDIIAVGLEYWNPNYLSTPHFRKVVPQDELDAILDPHIRRSFIDEGWKATAPGWPLWIGRLLFQKWVVNGQVKELKKMFRYLHQAGAKIVLGSDSAGWPILPYLVHGPSTHYEMNLLHELGMSSLEIITAATQTPTQMLGIDNELGTIEIGKRADLIVLNGNPLENFAVIHQPIWVMKKGEIHKAEDWLEVEKENPPSPPSQTP